ncbi:hypothetical protein I305_05101 [Cryptococcus gattii E566]|uniref:Uncharacterized protein n=2 Tax=Cryptococcus gattii TaxID=37769 RepID=E6RC95_CRYGW|nr:Hypothetical Protein CGB_I3190W [Cryptococcus gattii WM276]ADV24407.1 Hypothetical Protein CGB_I3190W [Cryptococcus gattii WM276]KIR76239.1 hypothetical protein I306_06774 [Cryptococcus gattii EJB2]KIY32530.1 hypothetical protein I305_05101 [Cryptococcus gattii E566]KJE02337.1 hypothetical protein I311_03925 [Cryptococcus gattii NT-10]
MTTMVLLPKRSLLRALLITSPLILIGLFVSLKSSSEPFEDDDVTGGGWSKTPAPRTHGSWWEGIQRGANWNPLDWVNSPVLKEEALDGDIDGWINFDEELKWTKYEGGVAGFQVFSNLYMTGGAFTAITPFPPDDQASSLFTDDEEEPIVEPESPFPDTKFIMSSGKRGIAAGHDRWRLEKPEMGRLEFGQMGYKLSGVTFIFNDGPGPEGYLVYFKHFATEAFLGAARVLASTYLNDISHQESLPKRIWFPRCGSSPSWRDERGENSWFLSRALPSASIEDATHFTDRILAGVTIQFEKIVIIDRWAAHSIGNDNGKWGKMNVLVPTVSARPNFFDAYRKNVAQSLGITGNINQTSLPVVIYIDYQKETPRLRPEDHMGLINALKSLTPLAEIHVVTLSGMSKSRQMELFSRAWIIIGVHMEGLTQAMWMPVIPGRSTVIELFEQGGFQRDFELMATAIGHQYVAVQFDRVLPEEEWRISGPSIGEEAKNGQISVNPEVVVRVVEDIVTKNDVTEEVDDI